MFSFSFVLESFFFLSFGMLAVQCHCRFSMFFKLRRPSFLGLLTTTCLPKDNGRGVELNVLRICELTCFWCHFKKELPYVVNSKMKLWLVEYAQWGPCKTIYLIIYMPYPCSHFYFDIKFGDRLYSKEKKRVWPVLFWI